MADDQAHGVGASGPRLAAELGGGFLAAIKDGGGGRSGGHRLGGDSEHALDVGGDGGDGPPEAAPAPPTPPPYAALSRGVCAAGSTGMAEGHRMPCVGSRFFRLVEVGAPWAGAAGPQEPGSRLILLQEIEQMALTLAGRPRELDRKSILGDTIDYMKELLERIERLQGKMEERQQDEDTTAAASAML